MIFKKVAEASRLRNTAARCRSHFMPLSVAFLILITFAKAEQSPKSQVDRLIAAARLYDEQEMKDAIDAIVSIGSPAIPELRPALKDFDDNVRWQAIIAMGRIGEPARGEVHRIIQALGDNDGDVRAAAAEALGMLKVDSKDVLHALSKRLTDEHGIVRASANWALWQFTKNSKHITNLTKELASSDWIVTDRAIRHLASIGNPADLHLGKYLLLKNQPGRHHAATALAQMDCYSNSIIPTLVQSLSDSDSLLATASAKALKSAGKAAVPSLIELLEPRNDPAQPYAILALGNIGESASPAISNLLPYLSHKDQAIRLSTVHTIGKIGVNAKGTEERVLELLKDPDQDLRGAACATLAQIKASSPKTLKFLQTLSQHDPKDFVRQAAKKALGKLVSSGITKKG